MPHQPLHFQALPDLAHNAIATHLTHNDMNHMIEASRWCMEVYGNRVQEVTLHLADKTGTTGGLSQRFASILKISRPAAATSTATIKSLLNRRPRAVSIPFRGLDCLEGLTEAMTAGHCQKLECIIMRIDTTSIGGTKATLQPLFDALTDGACPSLAHLSLWLDHNDADAAVMGLGKALRSRMKKEDKGCSGLKTLAIGVTQQCGITDNLRSVLSSGACEALETLNLAAGCALTNKSSVALSQWLKRTRGIKLHTLALLECSIEVAQALLQDGGVAPQLKVLWLGSAGFVALAGVLAGIGAGCWPELRDLSVFPKECEHLAAIQLLMALPGDSMRALDAGAPQLEKLSWAGPFINEVSMGGIASALRDGSCPRLAVLTCVRSAVSDGDVRDLAKVQTDGAACNATLSTIDLRNSSVGPKGARELAEAMTRGACPNLHELYLDENDLMDEGVVHLTKAMEAGAMVGLRQLGLCQVDMGDEGARALMRVLVDQRACPDLDLLDVRGNSISYKLKKRLDASSGSAMKKVLAD